MDWHGRQRGSSPHQKRSQHPPAPSSPPAKYEKIPQLPFFKPKFSGSPPFAFFFAFCQVPPCGRGGGGGGGGGGCLPWLSNRYFKTLKKLYDPFLWMRFNCFKATQALWGDSLLFNFKTTTVPSTHLIDLRRIIGWVYLVATRWC